MTAAFAQEPRLERLTHVTRSGRQYSVVASNPRTAFTRSRDPLIVVTYDGLYPREPVYLKVRAIIDLSERLREFRSNLEMVQAGAVAHAGKVIASGFQDRFEFEAAAAVRRAGLQSKEKVSQVLKAVYRAPSPTSLPTEDVHEIALVLAAGQPEYGTAAFETVHDSGPRPGPQVLGFGLDYVFSGQVFHRGGWRPPLAGGCARLLQAENPRWAVYIPFLVGRLLLAGAGGADLVGRVMDLTDGLDPGYSPLLSYFLFGDMSVEGELLRASALRFQARYEGR